MVDFKSENMSSESYYPNSDFIRQSSEDYTFRRSEIKNMGGNFEWPNSYWFIAKGRRWSASNDWIYGCDY